MLLEHLARRVTTDDGRWTTDAPAVSQACQAWAKRIRSAVRVVLASETRTPDLGGTATTDAVTQALIDSFK